MRERSGLVRLRRRFRSPGFREKGKKNPPKPFGFERPVGAASGVDRFLIRFQLMSSRLLSIAEKVAELVEPSLETMGFELVDVEYLSMHGKWVLRLYIDKEGGVTLDDCVRVSREMGDLIDVKDVILHGYVLEVSSPGLDRPLKKEKDLKSAIGKKIKVKTLGPLMGRRNYTGYLRGFREGILYMELESGPVHFSWKEVDKANLVYEFNS